MILIVGDDVLFSYHIFNEESSNFRIKLYRILNEKLAELDKY